MDDGVKARWRLIRDVEEVVDVGVLRVNLAAAGLDEDHTGEEHVLVCSLGLSRGRRRKAGEIPLGGGGNGEKGGRRNPRAPRGGFIREGAWSGLPSWPCVLGLGFFTVRRGRNERKEKGEEERDRQVGSPR